MPKADRGGLGAPCTQGGRSRRAHGDTSNQAASPVVQLQGGWVSSTDLALVQRCCFRFTLGMRAPSRVFFNPVIQTLVVRPFRARTNSWRSILFLRFCPPLPMGVFEVVLHNMSCRCCRSCVTSYTKTVTNCSGQMCRNRCMYAQRDNRQRCQ